MSDASPGDSQTRALVPADPAEAPGALALSSPRGVTVSWAANLVAALVLLVMTSGAWIVGALAAFGALVSGGSILPMLAIAATGILLGKGWHGLAQSVRARLRPADLSDVDALPEAVHLLSPQLRALVRDTRTVRASVQDPELEPAAIVRDAFDWITAVASVTGADRDTLADRGISAAALRAEVVALGEVEDPRPGVVDLLARVETALLDTGGDPFRGGARRRQ